MSKLWVRWSREIRLLTDELSQMRRELRTLQWSMVGVILLMIFVCLWMSRVRRSLNNGTTTSTVGTSVETICVQPPESPVMSPRSEATTEFVRVSNTVSSPPAQTVRYRRHVNVTPHGASRGLVVVLPQKPSVVAWFQRCLCLSHVFRLPSPRKVDSTNQTHIPGISRAPAISTSVVGACVCRRTPATRTSLSCSTRILLSLNL